MQSAEVVIVGGGVIGASIAYHLARLGMRDIVVIDRAPEPGAGSTSRATGGFRAQFSTEINVRLSLLSREKLLRFKDEIGADPGFAQHGYLFLARSEDALAQLRAAQAIQHACGLHDARMIDADEARAINPAVGDKAVIGGAFCPSDGFIRAMQILRGYIDAATRLGVRFVYGTEERPPSRIVVNAAGAWASQVCDVEVRPLRRQVAATVPTSVLPQSMPMTIWIDDGYHFRVREDRVLLLWPDHPPHGFDATVEDAWIERVAAMTHERVPILRDMPIDRAACWAGLYEMTPDKHPIIGWIDERMLVAAGASGHGVMHAPAIGELAAQMIAGEPTTIDVRSLRPSRFREGEAIVGSVLL
jgi:sarcosine oxidase subunit beta